MFTVTRFCVQAFAHKGGVLVADLAQQFRQRDQAVAAGRRAYRWAAGVAVYVVDGEPGSNLWREPLLIASMGDTPRLEWRSVGPNPYGATIVSLIRPCCEPSSRT